MRSFYHRITAHFVFDDMLWGACFLLIGAWCAQSPYYSPVESLQPHFALLYAIPFFLMLRLACRRQNPWLVWGCTAMLAFVIGTGCVVVRQWLVYTPVVTQDLWNTRVCGILSEIIATPRGQRWILTHITGDKLSQPTPRALRLVSRDEANIGDALCVQAHVQPLPAMSVPKGYDFATVMRYQSIGGMGRVIAILDRTPTPQYALARLLHKMRQRINQQLIVPERAQNSIIKALLTGDTADIPLPLLDAWRASGIVHILSVSGLHMAVVLGGTMLLLRYAFMLGYRQAALSGRYVWLMSGIALIIACGYLLLVGSSAPAVRSLMMSGGTLLAYALGGSLSATRTIFISAAAIVIFNPESVRDISFQLSFTAVLAVLIGVAVLPPAQHKLSLFGYLWQALRDVVWQGLLVTLVMSPLVAFTFNRLSFYGTIVNIVAVPITSVVIMPSLGIALLLWLVGWQQFGLVITNLSIKLLNQLAYNVQQWPYAVILVMRPSPLFVFVTTAICAVLLIHSQYIRHLFWYGVALCIAASLLLPSETLNGIATINGNFVLQRHSNHKAIFCYTKHNNYLRDQWLSRMAIEDSAVEYIYSNEQCTLPNIPLTQNGEFYTW